MRTLRLIPILLLGATVLALAESSREQAAAIDALNHADHFCFGGAGFAGAMSEGERNFRVLFTGKQPGEAFLTVFQKGNIQAKMYALVAMRTLDRPAYEKLLAQHGKSLARQEVATMAGCIVMNLPGQSVLDEIAKGRYDSYLQPD